ncbi:molybdate transport system substrate-binding protein [Rhizobiales bacterium GAS113]|jgi:molybdate transport system substrate-binding protein|nr:molybdate transport system substrate-binding protein [Rhizobiales bacterium GAS113]SED19490.1 molybdate transport system substrate-binding protein [Rhizobiales bacterium GAS188]
MLKLLHRFAVATFLSLAAVSGAAAQSTVTVFAAASLQDALNGIGKDFTAASGIAVKFSYDSSSTLARQIEQGAPAELFASADLDWMDYLAKRNLIAPATRVNLLGNRLVVIAPKESPLTEVKFDAASLGAALGDGRIATGAVESVPAGRYAKQALQKLGLWATFETRIVPAENVRAALAYVARGEAPLGIVYATDAAAEPKVKVVATFPQDSHPPIVYPFALTATAQGDAAKGEAAKQFLTYLQSPPARARFAAHGFSIVE